MEKETLFLELDCEIPVEGNPYSGSFEIVKRKNSGEKTIFVGVNGKLFEVDPILGTIIHQMTVHKDMIFSMKYLYYLGKNCLLTGSNSELFLIDIDEYKVLKELEGITVYGRDIIQLDDEHICACSTYTAKIFKLPEFDLLHDFTDHRNDIYCMTKFKAKRNWTKFAIAGGTHSLSVGKIYDWKEKITVKPISDYSFKSIGSSYSITSICSNEQEEFLVTGSSSRIIIWKFEFDVSFVDKKDCLVMKVFSLHENNDFFKGIVGIHYHFVAADRGIYHFDIRKMGILEKSESFHKEYTEEQLKQELEEFRKKEIKLPILTKKTFNNSGDGIKGVRVDDEFKENGKARIFLCCKKGIRIQSWMVHGDFMNDEQSLIDEKERREFLNDEEVQEELSTYPFRIQIKPNNKQIKSAKVFLLL